MAPQVGFNYGWRQAMQALFNFWTEEEGQDLIEYTLLMAFLALSCVTLLGNGRSIVDSIWRRNINNLETANNRIP
jgi:Flp pilus assembly pilin Flp